MEDVNESLLLTVRRSATAPCAASAASAWAQAGDWTLAWTGMEQVVVLDATHRAMMGGRIQESLRSRDDAARFTSYNIDVYPSERNLGQQMWGWLAVKADPDAPNDDSRCVVEYGIETKVYEQWRTHAEAALAHETGTVSIKLARYVEAKAAAAAAAAAEDGLLVTVRRSATAPCAASAVSAWEHVGDWSLAWTGMPGVVVLDATHRSILGGRILESLRSRDEAVRYTSYNIDAYPEERHMGRDMWGWLSAKPDPSAPNDDSRCLVEYGVETRAPEQWRAHAEAALTQETSSVSVKLARYIEEHLKHAEVAALMAPAGVTSSAPEPSAAAAVPDRVNAPARPQADVVAVGGWGWRCM